MRKEFTDSEVYLVEDFFNVPRFFWESYINIIAELSRRLSHHSTTHSLPPSP